MLKTAAGAAAPPFLVMDVSRAANALAAALPSGAPRVIRMEVGQPGTSAPAGAVAAAVAALSRGAPLGYTEALGLPLLRERIAMHYRDWYGVTVERERIAVTTGASGAFPLAFLAAFDVGDRVALAAPYYPPYCNILVALGMRPVLIETEAASRYQPTLAQLEALDPRPEGLIIASPGNPAGGMLAPEDFAAIAAWCIAAGVRLISDEIYHGLDYGMARSTAASMPGAVVINSFSKYFSMTGWRVGWMVLPEDLQRPVECLAQNFSICAPHISQVAAAAAFDCHDELAVNVAGYRRSRDHLLAQLPAAGLTQLGPADGAFYLYADLGELTGDSIGFCARLLAEAHVAATSGLDFDPRGGRFMRLSYCAPEADVVEAVRRVAAFLETAA